MKYNAEVDGLDFPVEIVDDHHVHFGEQTLEVDLSAVSGEHLYSLIVNGESYEGYIYPDEAGWQVLLRGQFYQVRVDDERERRLRRASQSSVNNGSEFILKAPMPGLVIAVQISEGLEVEKGQILLILESMKMQNELRSPLAGKIMDLKINAGDSVEQKQALLTVISKKTEIP